jgi:hypothetical protein
MTGVTAEVDLLDDSGAVVEHGTCTVTFEHGTWRARAFRSSDKPDQDWPLPPLHSFRVRCEL